jgi:tetratricopeptide (TPR) repeat protein
MRPLLICALGASLLPLQVFAAEARSVEELLKQVEPALEMRKTEDPGTTLRYELITFRNTSAAMEPQAAARRWLELLDAAVELSHHPERAKASSPVFLQEVYLAAPPPPAWDALRELIRARPVPAGGPGLFQAQALRVIAALLTGHPKEAGAAVDAIEAAAGQLPSESAAGEAKRKSKGAPAPECSLPPRGALPDIIDQLRMDLPDATTGDHAAQLEAELDALAQGRPVPGEKSLWVPALVPEIGAARAEAILRRALTAPRALFFSGDPETEALARRIAAEVMDQIVVAPWDLLRSFKTVPLFLRLHEHFPGKADQAPSSDEECATGFAIIGLAISDRVADARKLLTETAKAYAAREEDLSSVLWESCVRQAVEAGGGEKAWALLDEFARAEPALTGWKAYELVARVTGHLPDAIATMKGAGHAKFRPKARTAFIESLAEALLAADQVEEGIAALREAAAAEKVPKLEEKATQLERKNKRELQKLTPQKRELLVLLMLFGEAVDEALQGENVSDQEHLNHLARIANLARLTGDQALLRETVGDMAAVDFSPEELRDEPKFGVSVPQLFREAGRGEELEKRLLAAVASAAKSDAAPASDAVMAKLKTAFGPEVWNPAVSLIEFLAEGDRAVEGVVLFDRGEFWPVDDLAQVLAYLTSQASEERAQRFGLDAARAFHLAGRPETALDLVNTVIATRTYDAGAYELLLELLPPAPAAARLDELTARRPVDPLPMLWKGELMLREKRPAEAERCAREALLMMPFDDEHDPRAHAWRVIAGALEMRGDAGAAEARKRADALALLPAADELARAGLLSRALAQDEAAKRMFADEFAIEWRIAHLRSELGRIGEADAAWRRAAELLPSAVGRFTWRWADSDKPLNHAAGVARAEELWPQLAVREPENPRAHFVLALLQQSEPKWREADAQREFRRVVELDRDFYNAWSALQPEPSSPLRAECIANLARLAAPDINRADALSDAVWRDDLRLAWETVAALDHYYVPPAISLYPLRAAELAHRERASKSPELARCARVEATVDPEWRQGPRHGEDLFTPAAVVMSRNLIRLLNPFLGFAKPYMGADFHDSVSNFELPPTNPAR